MTYAAIDTKSSVKFTATQPIISLVIGFKTAFISNTKEVYNIWNASTSSNKCIPFSEQLVKIFSIIDKDCVPVDGVLYFKAFITSCRFFLPFMFYCSITNGERNKTRFYPKSFFIIFKGVVFVIV